jgi:NaMN:DMB phosphoribosyltransferase
MLCCLLSAVMAGNLAVAGRAGASLMHRPGFVAGAVLMIAALAGIAVAPAVAEHAGHYAARAETNHRSVLEELLAQPLCSGEAKS